MFLTSELFHLLGPSNRILVHADPDGEPARRDELSVDIAAGTGDATKLQTPPTGVGLGKVAVLGRECQKHPSTNTAIRVAGGMDLPQR